MGHGSLSVWVTGSCATASDPLPALHVTTRPPVWGKKTFHVTPAHDATLEIHKHKVISW